MSAVKIVTEVVADRFGLTVPDLMSHSAVRRIARPRQVVFWLLRQTTPLSYPKIAKAFGCMDHTTILHGVRMVEKYRDKNPQFMALTDALVFALTQKAAA